MRALTSELTLSVSPLLPFPRGVFDFGGGPYADAVDATPPSGRRAAPRGGRRARCPLGKLGASTHESHLTAILKTSFA